MELNLRTVTIKAATETLSDLVTTIEFRVDHLNLVRAALVSSKRMIEYSDRINRLRDIRSQITSQLEGEK